MEISLDCWEWGVSIRDYVGFTMDCVMRFKFWTFLANVSSTCYKNTHELRKEKDETTD